MNRAREAYSIHRDNLVETPRSAFLSCNRKGRHASRCACGQADCGSPSYPNLLHVVHWCVPFQLPRDRGSLAFLSANAGGSLVNGGQGQNRTADTRIFSPVKAIPGAYYSTTCSACQPRPQPHQGAI